MIASRSVFFCIALILFCAGCRQPSLRRVHLSPVQELEARINIPFPHGARLLRRGNEHEHEKYFLVRIPAELTQVTSFYRIEMERLGWALVTAIDSYKSLYYWRKPHRWCMQILYARGPSVTFEDLFVGG